MHDSDPPDRCQKDVLDRGEVGRIVAVLETDKRMGIDKWKRILTTIL